MAQILRKLLTGNADDTARRKLIMGVSAYAADPNELLFIPCSNNIPVIKTLIGMYSSRVTASLLGRTAWRITTTFQSSYNGSSRRTVTLVGKYDVLEKTRLVASLQSSYGARVTFLMVGTGSSTSRLIRTISGLYDVGAPVRLTQLLQSSYPVRTTATLTGRYRTSVRLIKPILGEYDVLDKNKITTYLESSYPVRITGVLAGQYDSTHRRTRAVVGASTHVHRVTKVLAGHYDVRAVNRRVKTLRGIYNVTRHVTIPSGSVTLKEVKF